jgi:hypothetical protein
MAEGGLRRRRSPRLTAKEVHFGLHVALLKQSSLLRAYGLSVTTLPM